MKIISLKKMSVCKWVVEACTCHPERRMPALRRFQRTGLDPNDDRVRIGKATEDHRKGPPATKDRRKGPPRSSDTLEDSAVVPGLAIDTHTSGLVPDRESLEVGGSYEFDEEIPVVGYMSEVESSSAHVVVERLVCEPDNDVTSSRQARGDVASCECQDVHGELYDGKSSRMTNGVELQQLVTKSNAAADHGCDMASVACCRIVAPDDDGCALSCARRASSDSDEDPSAVRDYRQEKVYRTRHKHFVCQVECSRVGHGTDTIVEQQHRCYSSLKVPVSLDDDTTSHLPPISVIARRPSVDLSVCGSFLVDFDSEPIHMTLEEVRSSFQDVKSPSAHSPPLVVETVPAIATEDSLDWTRIGQQHYKRNGKLRRRKLQFGLCAKNAAAIRSTNEAADLQTYDTARCLPRSLKHTLCHWLGIDKSQPHVENHDDDRSLLEPNGSNGAGSQTGSVANRALPPVPFDQGRRGGASDGQHCLVASPLQQDDGPPAGATDFASSIQKVKDYGWYWGPVSGEMAEQILMNEPDGSFIVRDSSDEHYIFSLTFKLNGFVRHVRIEHDHGNFSFGTFTIFKSHTIVEFIENAVQHSRSGRYLFFLHRRPILGPMRVQLLHPVSRFKQVQSLQHMCRFVILKVVRRDLIDNLPLPKRLLGYLNTPHYYAEQMQDCKNTNLDGGTASPQGVENRLDPPS